MGGGTLEDSVVWCPYTDREMPWSETTPEHVIPKSLGGVNDFCVRVERKANSDIESVIDARLGEEPWMKHRRMQLGMVGHSRKAPVMEFKRSELRESGEPVQVSFEQDGIHIWSPRMGRYIPPIDGMEILSTWTGHINTSLRFVAKVALSAGCFVYGDLLRRAVAHGEIRFLMEFDLGGVTAEGKARLRQRAASMGVKAEDWLRAQENPDAEVFRLIAQAYGDASVVGFRPTRESLLVFVGVLGRYVGLVDAPADTSDFPSGGHHDLGHVIVLRARKLERYSLQRAAYRLQGLLKRGWRPRR